MRIMGSQKKKTILKVPEGTKTVAAYKKNLEFTIFVYVRTEWEEQQVTYLNDITKTQKMTSKDIVLWCARHKMECQVVYPVTLIKIIKEPLRYLRYRELEKIRKIV